MLTPDEARRLIRSIPADTVAGLRDRALIGVMIYTFARISAALKMDVKDVYPKQESLWVRLREKGGKHHEMPCQHNLKRGGRPQGREGLLPSSGLWIEKQRS